MAKPQSDEKDAPNASTPPKAADDRKDAPTPQKDAPTAKADAPKAEKDEPTPEENQAQAQASTRSGGVPGPAPDPVDPKDAEEAQEAVADVATHLSDLDRASLVALNSAVESALRNKGQDAPGAVGPTLEEVSGSLPVNDEDDGASLSAAVKAVNKGRDEGDEIKDTDVVDYAVRQAKGAGNAFTGPKYVRVVTRDGQKRAAEL